MNEEKKQSKRGITSSLKKTPTRRVSTSYKYDRPHSASSFRNEYRSASRKPPTLTIAKKKPKQVVTPAATKPPVTPQDPHKGLSEEDIDRLGTTETSRVVDLIHRRSTWSKVIDLCHETVHHPGLPGAHLSQMKVQNNVFWTYDPRGVDHSVMDDEFYCVHCHCPYHYCANRVFGEMCTTHLSYLIKQEDDERDITTGGMKDTFKVVYWEMVQAKMMMNKVPFPSKYDFSTDEPLPRCIKDGALRSFIREYNSQPPNPKYDKPSAI